VQLGSEFISHSFFSGGEERKKKERKKKAAKRPHRDPLSSPRRTCHSLSDTWRVCWPPWFTCRPLLWRGWVARLGDCGTGFGENYGGLPLDARAWAETAPGVASGNGGEPHPTPRPRPGPALGAPRDAIAAVRVAPAVAVTCGGATGSSALREAPVPRVLLASALCVCLIIIIIIITRFKKTCKAYRKMNFYV
jgi:hypothetical protein